MRYICTSIVATLMLTGYSIGETHTVLANSMSFSPESIDVMPGDIIHWQYNSGYPHTVTSGSSCTADGLFDGPLNGGKNPFFAWDVPPDAIGEIPYFCAPHCEMGMTGLITVLSAGTIHVPEDFDNIQDAIDAAADGALILVDPGVYTASTEGGGGAVVNMMGKAITLRATSSASDTIIDGENINQCIKCVSGETRKTIIEGFTLTNGGNVYEGGGILCRPNSSPTIIDCIITGNDAIYGGGVTCRDNSSPLLQGCKIYANGDDGLYCEDDANPELIDCEIYDNEQHGILCSNSGLPSIPIITSTTICGNGNTQLLIKCDDCDVINGGGSCVSDSCDDNDNNGFPDGIWCGYSDCGSEPYCPADLNDGCEVDVNDLLIVIDQWESSNTIADINNDGTVDVNDLLIVIGAWGPCP